MKKNFLLAGNVLVAAFIFTSCTKNHGDTNTGNSGATPGPLFTAVKSMMSTNCAISGCHVGSSPQNGLDFSNESTIVAQKARIKVRAVDQAGTANQMPKPPKPTLSAADQKKITDWLDAGGRLTD
jgi:uncharacterized membrane protein